MILLMLRSVHYSFPLDDAMTEV